MNIASFEREILQLPVAARAALAHKLLESLDDLSEVESEQLWLDEAARRATEIDEGRVKLVSGDDVEREVRSILECSSENHHAHP